MLILFIPLIVMAGCLDTNRPHFLSQITGASRCPRVTVELTEELIPSSGDLGDFASFVAHMKKIAIVRVFFPSSCELALKTLFRSATLIFCSSILEIFTMVCIVISTSYQKKIHPHDIIDRNWSHRWLSSRWNRCS